MWRIFDLRGREQWDAAEICTMSWHSMQHTEYTTHSKFWSENLEKRQGRLEQTWKDNLKRFRRNMVLKV
jgi:hypothetical protein